MLESLQLHSGMRLINESAARLGWEVVEDLVYEELPVTVMKFTIPR